MIKGSLPALVTPFKNGELDLDALKHLIEWHIEQGSDGLVPVGTTGESRRSATPSTKKSSKSLLKQSPDAFP